MATRIDLTEADGTTRSIDLGENDLVFITNGGCVENSSMGSQNHGRGWTPDIKPGGGWDMWRRIAAQDPSFGHPDVFCSDPEPFEVDERHRHHVGRRDSAVHPENLQARPVLRTCGDRRHRHR